MWFAIVAILLYLISILLIAPMLLKAQAGEQTKQLKKTRFFLTALVAVACHFASLYPLLDHLLHGQPFTLTGIGSLLGVLVAFLATFSVMLRVQTQWFLLPVVYCFAIIHLILNTLLPEGFVQYLVQDAGLLIHIALALFAYAVCCITSLYAVQLWWLDRNLKQKKMTISPMIPPLMAVERHFFSLLLIAELLLSLTLISGAIYLADFFAPHNIQKAGLSFLAWIVFGVALIGHWKLYWRGKKMIIYTISGMILLTLAYLGSRVMFGFSL